MRVVAICAVILGVLLPLVAQGAHSAGKSPPEAAPVIALLQAVKASDVQSFKNVYSQRIRDDKDQGDWPGNLAEARGNLEKMYGDYRLDDFTFTYSGDDEAGKVSLSHKHDRSLELDVIKEAGEWKIDIR